MGSLLKTPNQSFVSLWEWVIVCVLYYQITCILENWLSIREREWKRLRAWCWHPVKDGKTISSSSKIYVSFIISQSGWLIQFSFCLHLFSFSFIAHSVLRMYMCVSTLPKHSASLLFFLCRGASIVEKKIFVSRAKNNNKNVQLLNHKLSSRKISINPTTLFMWVCDLQGATWTHTGMPRKLNKKRKTKANSRQEKTNSFNVILRFDFSIIQFPIIYLSQEQFCDSFFSLVVSFLFRRFRVLRLSTWERKKDNIHSSW